MSENPEKNAFVANVLSTNFSLVWDKVISLYIISVFKI